MARLEEHVRAGPRRPADVAATRRLTPHQRCRIAAASRQVARSKRERLTVNLAVSRARPPGPGKVDLAPTLTTSPSLYHTGAKRKLTSVDALGLQSQPLLVVRAVGVAFASGHAIASGARRDAGALRGRAALFLSKAFAFIGAGNAFDGRPTCVYLGALIATLPHVFQRYGPQRSEPIDGVPSARRCASHRPSPPSKRTRRS
mmetsp:Transcript_11201/g.38156  ORF Transcript_11201/g.38156 Transcript_11201/m.38156 type:complete len:202 (-) Transcript_11201:126-731(-)